MAEWLAGCYCKLHPCHTWYINGSNEVNITIYFVHYAMRQIIPLVTFKFESCLLLCLERHGWDNSAKQVLLVDCCKTTIQERDQVAITWESPVSFGSIINLCYVYQVKRLLTVNPVDRITAKEALLHPFFEVHDVEHDRTALRRVKVRFYPHAPWKLLLLCEVLCLVC